MSQESQDWLENNILVGFTEKRGEAWWYRGAGNNHFVGAVPVEEVENRLFSWTAEESPVEYAVGGQVRTAPDRKVIYRSDTGDALGVFKSGYVTHQPKPWLMDNVETITDSELEVGSAGLLKGGAQAWVQFELPETVQAAEGVAFRPFISAATSFDGSIATTYFGGAQMIVCDNTLAAGLASADGKFKVKHSRHSLSRISDAREALGIVYQAADAFQDEVAKLTAEFVSDDEWADFVAAYTAPSADSDRSRGISERRAGELNSLWNADERVEPWKNSAFGVLQAVNTHAHHVQTVRNASRVERNFSRVITGGIAKLDQETLELLTKVTHRELAVAA